MSLAQSGKNNSQYGKIWVTSNDLQIHVKINQDLINEYYSQGWFISRSKSPYKAHTIQNKLENTIVADLNRISLLHEYRYSELKEYYSDLYLLYNSVCFDQLVWITNWPYTRMTLINRFIRYVDDFKPQNGKNRTESRISDY